MVGASQQDPSTPTSTRGGDPSASSAFASPLQLPEAGVFLQGIPCLVGPEGQPVLHVSSNVEVLPCQSLMMGCARVSHVGTAK